VTPIRLERNISKQLLRNSWKYYLATIANYNEVCCEAIGPTVGYPINNVKKTAVLTLV